MNQMKRGVDYIGLTVVFYCHDGDGNFLLHKRSEKCQDEQGTWDCGGGSLEFGEGFEDGVKREIREEYGCDTEEIQFAGVHNVLRTNRQGRQTHWVALIYSVRLNPDNVTNADPDKITEIGWFTPENFPQPRHSMLMRHFEAALKVI